MFGATGAPARADAAELEGPARRYAERAMAEGTFHAWVVEADGAVVAGGGLQLRTLMARQTGSAAWRDRA